MKKEELTLARQMISGLEGEFDPAELRSEYRTRLRALLEAKLEGRELVEPEPVAEGSGDRSDGSATGLGCRLEGRPPREEARRA